jgi:hypothetical protein
MPTTMIFDLDGTVICSKHRQATLADGSLDLPNWVANSTPQKVENDSLLPMAAEWKRLQTEGCLIVVCTARVMSTPDYQFLFNNGLYYNAILSRPLGCALGDGELKEFLLRQHARDIGVSFARFMSASIMFDDNWGVINHLTQLGLSVYNATSINESLAKVA